MAGAGNNLRAGVAHSDITTDAAGALIRDRLYAKALVLDDGVTRLAIITMDTTAIGARSISDGFLDDVADDFLPRLRSRIEQELDIPGDHVMVNASHTHPPGRLLCDDDEQVIRTFDAVSRAFQNLTEVRVGAGSGREDRITMNRTLRLKSGRDWTVRHSHPSPPEEEIAAMGPMDPEIGIIRIDRLDGTPLAVVYNFACHPMFGDTQGSITANFPGIASKLIEEDLGHGAMAFFLQGAAGDIIDVGFKDFSQPRDIDPLGTMLGRSTLDAWRKIKTGSCGLGLIFETVDLPRRTDIPERIAARQQEQAELLESLRFTSLNFESFLPLYGQGNPDADPASMDAFNAKLVDKYLQNLRTMERLTMIQDDIATLQKHQAINAEAGMAAIASEIQGIRIGDAVVITSQAELLAEIGLNLKQASPHEQTLVAAFSNGYLHYAPPADMYPRGGYEVTECLLAPEWQAVYETTAFEILGSV